MDKMKCSCGNKGCSTCLEIYESSSYIDIIIMHNEKDGTEKRETIALDPNAIVYLIKQLKQALVDIA